MCYLISGKKADCCGCRACEDICQSGAIQFREDYEGFLYPEIDRSKCIDCGLCEKVCSANFDLWLPADYVEAWDASAPLCGST